LGQRRLSAFLRRHRRILLDTSLFIYQFEAYPRYVVFTDAVFAWLEEEGHSGVTSAVTLTEMLVQPYRVSDQQRADLFLGVLSTYPNLEWISVDLEIADEAARIRGVHRLQTPDALQAATAIVAGATGVVTNDRVFERVGGFETLVLEDLL
jgi:predicted nucleic acid-binding protein